MQTIAVAAAPELRISDWPGRQQVGINIALTQQAMVGYPFSYPILTVNPANSYSVTGLPRGLTVNPNNGVISGRPEVAGDFPLVVSATNTDGTSSANVTLNVQPAPTAAPVITAPALIDEVAYHGFTGRDLSTMFGEFIARATNGPTSFAASGVPPNVRFDPATGYFSWPRQMGGPPPGMYTTTVTATNAIGSGTATIRWILRPRLRSYRGPSGSVVAGQTFSIEAVFDGPVNVTGTPSILMTWGDAPAQQARMRYTSGSGTAVLRFSYQPTLNDAHENNTHLSHFITLDGGAINDAASGLPATPNIASEGTGSASVYIFSGFALPPTTGPSPGTPPAAPLAQTIAVNVPATVTVGQPVTVGATATSGLPVTLEITTGNAVLNGSSLTATATGSVAIRASQSGGSGYSSATTTVTVSAVAAPAPPPPSAPVPPPSTPTPVAPAPVVPTPVTPAPVVPAVPTSPVFTLTAQTVAFDAVGSIVVGQPVTLSASASSGLPTTLSLVSGNATLSANRLTAHDTAAIVVRATQPGNSTYAAAAATLSLSASRLPQVIDFVTPVSAIVIGQPIRLGATTSSGLPLSYAIVSGPATISGDTLTVTGPGAVVIRASQAGSDTVAPASTEITLSTAARAAQTIAFATAATEIRSDQPITLTATSSAGLPVTFQVVSGPASMNGNLLTPTAATGQVVIRARQGGNEAMAPVEITRTLTIVSATRVVNLSSRVFVQEGDASRSFIAGFVVSGPGQKRILARAIGPTLANFGVQGSLSNPRLQLFDSAGRLVGQSDDWSGAEVSAASARVGAFPLAEGSRDAAILLTLSPGAYSIHVTAQGGEGVALAEIYDASEAPAMELPQLINISTRAHVGTGEGLLTAGFVVTGTSPKRVLIRGVGPGLAAFGVSGVIANPMIQLYRGTSLLAENDNWHASAPDAASSAELSAAATAAGAFALEAGSLDAGLIVTLPPGAYTALVSGANGGTGVGLIEVYEIAPGAR